MHEFIRENTLTILSICFALLTIYIIYLTIKFDKFKNNQIQCNSYHKFLIQLGICNRIQHAYFHNDITKTQLIGGVLENAWAYEDVNPTFTLLYECDVTPDDLKTFCIENKPELLPLVGMYEQARRGINNG